MADDVTADEKLLGAFIPIHYHYNMLLDEARMTSFCEAIDLLTPPGGKVLELGGGTGVLSHFAARKASRVWCVERHPDLVIAAREFLELNGSGSRVEVVRADAREYLPPEPVDLVICEMLHVALAREKQLHVLQSFKRRYLQKFGLPLPRFVPEASLLAMQPVQQSFDFNGYVANIPIFQAPGGRHESTHPLSEPVVYGVVEYGCDMPTHFRMCSDFTMATAGELNAVRFVTRNILAFPVTNPTAVEWSNQYLVLPLTEGQNVQAGEQVNLSVDYQAGCELDELTAGVKAIHQQPPTGRAAIEQLRIA